MGRRALGLPLRGGRVVRAWVAAALVLGMLWRGVAWAGGGPENVVVVVNADSWASLAVANEFIHLRRVPASNVVYLDGLPDFEQTDVETFRQRVLAPVFDAIEQRKLARQIDYVVYSADLPYAVSVRKDVGSRKLPKVITLVAASTGLTYLHHLVRAKNPAYLSLAVNGYFRRVLRPGAQRPVQTTAQERQQHVEAMKHIREKKWETAARTLRALLARHAQASHLHYNLACCLARLGKADEAMAALGRAVEAGWAGAAHAKADKDLEALRGRKDFEALLEKMRSVVFDVQASRGFRSTLGWGPRGVPVPIGGARYMLSTVLAVTSGRGNSVREALDALRRSAAADGTRPKGTIYYVRNSNVRSRAREGLFRSAVAKLQASGVRAEIVEGREPKGKTDVAGAMLGTATLNWKASGSTILPGAICDHLTSTGGVLREHAGQTPLTELLRHGAAGASGTVTEPYAIAAKFPTAFLHVHYARGCTLAEAFYQSVAGPYQLLIVGDPLCRPWARIPQVTVEGVEPNAAVKGRVTLRPGVRGTGPPAVDHYELFVDGLRAATCKPSAALALDTTQHPDGRHELRVVAICAGLVATQGRLVLPVEIRNGGHRLEVEALSETTLAWDRPLRLRATLKGAREITFRHNVRPLATLRGEEGEATIDLRRVGQGRVTLHAVGILKDEANTRVFGRPVHVTVVPPPALPAIKAPSGAQLVKGLRLAVKGGKPVAVEDTRRGDWLAKMAKAGQPFRLTGYFDVPAKDVYQFQVRTNCTLTIEVDGAKLEQRKGAGWQFLPVSLAAGLHRLAVRGKAAARPRLDMRFGGPGARRLSARRFRHLAPERQP